jgi:hypothetical protein
MSVGPDLHSLDTAAARLEQHAAELRSRANRLQAASESLVWRSSAASAFRQHNETICAQLRRGAERLEHAATVLHRHASTARSRMDVAEGAVTAGLHLVGL